MLVECPHCGKKLKAGEKFRQKVAELKEGASLSVKCVSCSQAFTVPHRGKQPEKKVPEVKVSEVRPPAPPDVSWLAHGLVDEDESDCLPALVLVKSREAAQQAEQTLAAFGYLVEFAASPTEALEKMRFVRYAAIILSSDYQQEPLAQSALHNAIIEQGMSWRREAIYLLLGDEFDTLYDLQALSLSANAVVNTSDIGHLPAVFQRVLRDHKELFGPFIQELKSREG